MVRRPKFACLLVVRECVSAPGGTHLTGPRGYSWRGRSGTRTNRSRRCLRAGARHGRGHRHGPGRHHAAAPRERRSLRASDSSVEPEDEALHLHRAQRHLHHRSPAVAAVHRPRLRVHQGDRRAWRLCALRGHQEAGTGGDRRAGPPGIPVIAILDTNCDPDEVNYPIPGNDDAIRSVALLTRVVADAVADGLIARAGRAAGEEKPQGDGQLGAAEPLAEWERELLEGRTLSGAPEANGTATAAEAPAAEANEAEAGPAASAEPAGSEGATATPGQAGGATTPPPTAGEGECSTEAARPDARSPRAASQ